jgi:hypothetical protein
VQLGGVGFVLKDVSNCLSLLAEALWMAVVNMVLVYST